MIKVESAGYNGGNFANIIINGEKVRVMKNENGTYRGLHFVILNTENSNIEFSKAFDTYKSSK